MKRILGDIVVYTLILYFIANATPAMKITGGLESYFFAAVVLAVANTVVKPLLSIISVPFIMMTLGLFTFVLNGLILFGLTKVYPAVSVHGFNLNSIDIPVALPSLYIPTILSYVVLSVIIELIRRVVSMLYSE